MSERCYQLGCGTLYTEHFVQIVLLSSSISDRNTLTLYEMVLMVYFVHERYYRTSPERGIVFL